MEELKHLWPQQNILQIGNLQRTTLRTLPKNTG
jgi:hypothetical protein